MLPCDEMTIVSPARLVVHTNQTYQINTVTNTTMRESDLVEKGTNVDEMVQHMAHLVEISVETLCGEAYDAKGADRPNHRNGYGVRTWEPSTGSMSLRVPELRQESYPLFLEPRRTTGKALSAMAHEARGSTHSVDERMKVVCMGGVFKSQVSRLCAELDEQVPTFLDHPLEGDWPYLWIDATYGQIVSVTTLIAVAVNNGGQRQVLGMQAMPSEAEPFWTDFLHRLLHCGLRGVRLVISDAHLGINAALAEVFNSTWQCCRMYVLRYVLPARRQGPTAHGQRRHCDGFRPKLRVGHPRIVAHCRRPVVYRVSKNALHADLFRQSAEATQSRGQTAHQRSGHLPQRRGDHTPCRRLAVGSKSRCGHSIAATCNSRD